MKHLSIPAVAMVCALTTALSACHQSRNRFTLHGELSNLEGKEVYLFGKYAPNDRIDTIQVTDGRFSYQAEIDTLTQLTLLFDQDRTLPLFVEKQWEVSVKGDARQPDLIKVTGGEANEELNQFKHLLAQRNDTLSECTVADSFITHHPFSQVSVYLLDRYFISQPQPDHQRIRELTKGMGGILHDHPLVARMEKQMEKAFAADTGRYVSNFRMKRPGKEDINSYNYREKVMTILFWATWDKQSMALRDSLTAMQKKLKKEDAILIEYSLDTDKSAWKAAAESDTLYAMQVFDGNGWNGNSVKLFNIEDVPTIVVLSAQRRIALRTTDMEAVHQKVKELIQAEKNRKKKLKH